MLYKNVCIAGLGYMLPSETVTSADIEQRLEPLYQRLRLPAGRLELMSGIAARRLWPQGQLPSEMSILSGRMALEAAGVDASEVGLLIHASVCRDHLEPATACRVHHYLGLPAACLAYDISNACLGILNGMLQVANLIELGAIRAGLVVGTESSRALLETTIDHLNRDTQLTRRTVKTAIASLTIGSASCGVVLTARTRCPHASPLITGVARAHTQHHRLCQSGRDEAVGDGMQPLMDTDSEALMRHGVATAEETFADLLRTTGWSATGVDRTVCHQVGVAHRKMLLDSLGLPTGQDYVTYPWLGNTGSAALPVTLARAVQDQHFSAGDNVGLLGIGSGINCVMLGAHWQETPVRGSDLALHPVADRAHC